MEKHGSDLCQWIVLYNNYFNYLNIDFQFTNQITLKPILAQKLKLIFKFSTIKGQICSTLDLHGT